MPLYALTVFLSAFLLFLLEPLVAKMILPWFGGSAGVWTICLVFFQAVLLLGYLYAHLISRRLSPRSQALAHLGLLAASLLFLPITPSQSWKPHGGEDPSTRILGLLLASVGLPYFLLSSTGPLLQSWYTRRESSAFPYRLFALSNLASLIALLLYPFEVEPKLTTGAQSLGWSIGYAVFAVLCGVTAWRARNAPLASTSVQEESTLAPGRVEQLFWLALAACGSVLLLAITNQLCQNIAAIPFLWILPLAVYLLTFILCFEGHGLYHRRLFLPGLAFSLGITAYYLTQKQGTYMLQLGIPIFLIALFVGCMFCHGELAARKPAPRYLTSFYVMISLGGAIGALLVGIVAPLVFSNVYEIAVGLLLTSLLAFMVAWPRGWMERILWATVSVGMAWTVFAYVREYNRNSLAMVRNFYGGLRVTDFQPNDPERHARVLFHGTINHGAQFMNGAHRSHPTTYYGEESGAGLALKYGCETPCKAGMIGLGTGTLASYGRPGDVYRFYEINPLVLKITHDWFGYMQATKAQTSIELGDARLTLEREPSQQFDVLIVDAFSGDAIPVHLLTREALDLYLRHMKPEGVIAFHVSNHYLDLAPVVERLASLSGRQSRLISDPSDDDELEAASDWVLVTARADFFNQAALSGVAKQIPPRTDWRTWTDSYNNLFQVLRW